MPETNDKPGDLAPEIQARVDKLISEAVAKKESDIQSLKASHNKVVADKDKELTKLRRDLELTGADDSDDDADAKTDLGKTRSQIAKRHELEDKERKLAEQETAARDRESKWETTFLEVAKQTYKASGVPDEILGEASTVAELHKLAKAYLAAVKANDGKGGTSEKGTGRIGATDGKPAGGIDSMEAIKLAIKQGRAATFGA